MTLTTQQLRDRLKSRFDDAQDVDKAIVRFTRKTNGDPFAVYYIDVGSQLPKTAAELVEYQDRVIGPKYFDGKKSLQWNNYLYFVVGDAAASNKDTLSAKSLIESDRAYARKHVVVESELDAALDPPRMSTAASLPEASILAVWQTKLASAGLDVAVLSDKSLPNRLSQIESSTVPTSSPPSIPQTRTPATPLPFLKSIRFAEYRVFPTQREFDFGAVNLIAGVNGSGKTSLLEAIELLYCGRNKRNADAEVPYSIAVEYADGTKEVVSDGQQNSLFRHRNLLWYGQAEVKTNNLVASFSLFNFLDTDAAVRLADSTARWEEDLSNLLVGAEASKAWNEIGRMQEAVAGKLRESRPVEKQINEELVSLATRLKEAGSIKQESDSISARLQEMLQRLKWKVSVQPVAPGLLVESLSELSSLTEQAVAFKGAQSPVSMDRLSAYCNGTQQIIDKARREMTSLEGYRAAERKANESVKRCVDALSLTEQVRRILEAGLPARVTEWRECQKTIALQTGIMAGCDEGVLTALATMSQEVTVVESGSAAIALRAAAQSALNTSQKEYDDFSRMRQYSLSLAQQLRDIADSLLEGSPKPDECPLCHSQFNPGELAKHMQLGVDQQVESRSQQLLSTTRRCKEALASALLIETASNWLGKFCERAKLKGAVTVGRAVREVANARRILRDAQNRVTLLTKELKDLEEQGITYTRLDELVAGLGEVGFPLVQHSAVGIEQVQAAIEKEREANAKILSEEKANGDSLQQSLESALGVPQATHDVLRSTVSQITERRAFAASLLSKLTVALKSFSWPTERSLSELIVEVSAIRTVAVELQGALGREQHAKSTTAELTTRRDLLNIQLAELTARLERFVRADKTLTEIQKHHSLSGAMKAALSRNRAAIEEIFTRIHSPAEFVGLGKGVATLVRKDGVHEATLNQISTGQRAAFALSIFLAQNSQLRSAPPVILIDDPIAHIDDLNALAFLDYLREIAISGTRQIFFATASEKLAVLFQRKFDFLGGGFRHHDLRR